MGSENAVIELILRAGVQDLFDDAHIVRTTPAGRGPIGCESRFLTAIVFD